MKISCCCGIFTGFILALLCVAAVWYYFYCRENPDAPEKSMVQVEKTWEKTKDTGDQVINFVKPYTRNNNSEVPSTPAN